MRLVRYKDRIGSDEHLKHWLIRVTVNCCKEQFDNAYRRYTVPLGEAGLSLGKTEEGSEEDEFLKYLKETI